MRISTGWAELCLALAACDPVLLDDGSLPAGSTVQMLDTAGPKVSQARDALDATGAVAPLPEQSAQPATTPEPVRAHIRIGASDCGGCFALVAVGWGGTPPYRIEWSDGVTVAQRSVCVSEPMRLSAVVQDAVGARSEPYRADLQARDAGCNDAVPMLCLQNASFEAVPTGGVPPLEVAGWVDCTSDGYLNRPDIGSTELSPSAVVRPEPTHGEYYLGLSEDEQVSQRMCEIVQAAETRRFEVDLMRVRRSVFAVNAPQQNVFLEVWGGIATDCSQRQLLWASPPLTDTWERHCVTLTSSQLTDQLTLRARSDFSSIEVGYIAVDNLVPVERCTAP